MKFALLITLIAVSTLLSGCSFAITPLLFLVDAEPASQIAHTDKGA